MSGPWFPIYTVGHSTHELGTFLALLRKHDVSAVADVRSAPYSRFNPHFNKAALQKSLKEQGIRYVFLGRELGARSGDASCYEEGRVQYTRLAGTSLFKGGLERVVRGAKEYRLALLCAEKEPLECHRTLLVARALVERGLEVRHILADGRVEEHGDAMNRLMVLVGLPHEDLFRSKEELILEALARQEERVAWVDEKMIADGPTGAS